MPNAQDERATVHPFDSGIQSELELELSFVIPVMDEEATLRDLTQGIILNSKRCVESFEIIFIDDGSSDGSWLEIMALSSEYSGIVQGVRFRKNMGKAHALSAGFREAKGQRVITMDADLQDDPVEIPRLLDKADQGFDLIVGWKRERKDPASKLISSKLFNWLANRVSGLSLHDHNCGFKCYRRDLLEQLRLYGDMHRMVPSLAAASGFSIAEVAVKHHPRMHGVSKYGFGRGLRSCMDLFTVLFLRHFKDRPSHFIGPLAMLMLLGGVTALLFGLYRDITTGQGKVLLTVGPMAIIVGLTLFNTSLVAELLVHENFSRSWAAPIIERVGEPVTRMQPSTPATSPRKDAVETQYS